MVLIAMRMRKIVDDQVIDLRVCFILLQQLLQLLLVFLTQLV